MDLTCLPHMWYLAVDMQLFIFAPSIVYVLWIFGKKALNIFIVATILMMYIRFYRFEQWVYMKVVIKRLWKFICSGTMTSREAWRQTHHRAVPYMMGIITGCFIHFGNNKTVIMNKLLIVLGWTLAVVFLTKPSFIPYDFFREAWAASFCWIIFACHQLKSGSIVRSFLSQSFWEPLSKISLSVYVVHYLYIIISDANQKEIHWFHAWWQIVIYIGDIFVSFTLGTLLYLSVEAPAVKITQLLLHLKVDSICKTVVSSLSGSRVLKLIE